MARRTLLKFMWVARIPLWYSRREVEASVSQLEAKCEQLRRIGYGY